MTTEVVTQPAEHCKPLAHYDTIKLGQLLNNLDRQYRSLKSHTGSMNFVRGIPSPEQVKLSEALDGVLKGNYQTESGIDTRNYGGLDGISEAKALFSGVLDTAPANLLVAGNSSLALMYEYVSFAHHIGVNGPRSAWAHQSPVRFICPVPGYDRHFSICEHLGIEMVTVPMTDRGPDMDAIIERVRSDRHIKGLWCVPKYSNPTGCCYSPDTVAQLAELPRYAADGFRILWDNAYALHDFDEEIHVDSLLDVAQRQGTDDAVIMFGSMSKVTLPGAAVAFMAANPNNLQRFKQHLQITTIGPDKVNQLRHVRFFNNLAGIKQHMLMHAQILKPKFQLVRNKLAHITPLNIATWTHPAGGYYISLNTLPGLAKTVVSLCAELGVQLTPAGATYPYGRDPDDSHIRLAPSYPSLAELDDAMDVFICCLTLAAVKQQLSERHQTTW